MDAVALADFLGSPDLCWFAEFGGFVKQHLIGDELPEVLVGGHHVGDKALLFGFFRQGSDNIIGFVAFYAIDRDVEGLDEPDDVWYSLAEVVRHLLAVGFVVAVFGLPLGGAGYIESYADVGGLLVFQNLVK